MRAESFCINDFSKIFLPRDAMLARYMLSSCVGPSFRLSFRLSSVHHTPVFYKTTKRGITGITPYTIAY